ncbi:MULTISPECIES: hypothetical protein [Streptacidiphilus]|uniref:DUF3344 domain-containing protein n=2 Tax=Streptacidiphilus TaxID=228398 RepID=A0ABV6UZF9_9ACTN|nr:hypothetical protein [Streptacidiphilus jeojiense]
MTTPRSRKLIRATVAVAVAGAAAASQLVFASGSGALAPARPGPLPVTRAGDSTGQHPIPMKTRYQADMNGSITRIANTLMTCDEKKPPVTPGVASCLDARKGIGQGIYNNNYIMRYVNQYPGKFKLPASEGGGYETLYSSSGAVMNLSKGSDIKYARLYWGGTRGLGNDVLPLTKVDGVLFKGAKDKTYHEVNTDDNDLGYMTGIGTGNAMEHGYQASADVTDIVRKNGNGNYIVADMDSKVQSHSWGGWTLVVAYENCDLPYRHITLDDGFQIELPKSAPIKVDISDLKTPASGPIKSVLGYVAYDGDRTYTGDTVTVKSTNGPLTQLSLPEKPANDFMNSTIIDNAGTVAGARTPNYVNQMGYDSNRLDISDLMRNGDTGLEFTFDTKLDGYQIGAIFSYTDLE